MWLFCFYDGDDDATLDEEEKFFFIFHSYAVCARSIKIICSAQAVAEADGWNI